jgi:Holliday junction DNA helicase RuvA
VIASLRGLIQGRTDGSLIIDVGGVGYLVNASQRTLSSVGATGAEVSLLVITQVREDAITLFGFQDSEERDSFRLVTSVQGVGPKVGLALLSALDPPSLLSAIASGDRTALCRADGVGPKLAVRMATELRDKSAAMSLAIRAIGPADRTEDALQDGARTALTGLGYSKAEVAALIADVTAKPNAPVSLPAMIAACLRIAGSRGI